MSKVRPVWLEDGQATVEYVVVAMVLVAGIVALGALWRFTSGDGAAQLVSASASHAVGEKGGLVDVLLF